MNMSSLNDLKKLHTKQLLKLLEITRMFAGCYRDGDFFVTAEELKAELATREHVPTGAEAKKIRQQKAKNKKNR